jgi:S-DNA-T family DNA segregation ATPase FtsK/SpoIIIE
VTPRPNALSEELPEDAVVTGTAGPVDELVTKLRALTPGSLVLVDDAEMVREGELAPALSALIRQAREKSWCVVVAGETAQLTAGLSGWLYEARRGRQGLLLSPQTLADGEVMGLRLTRSVLTSKVLPGRGLLIESGGDVLIIQAPLV